MDSIKVVCRIRPPHPEEDQMVIHIKDHTMVKIISQQVDSQHFSFDRVFKPQSAQSEVYEQVGFPLIKEIFKGLNVTILAYGQTSSGKTYTMEGYGRQKGIIPRLVHDIYHKIEQESAHSQFRVKVSVLEIYTQKLRDLLSENPLDNPLQLKIRQSKSKGIFIENLVEIYVRNQDQLLQVLKIGQANRTVSATKMNDLSSRSHSICVLGLHQNDLSLEDSGALNSKVILVDLAGSQKVSKTGAKDKLLDEAKHINKSLSALGNVINALTEGKSIHIPYRDSKLTRILQDSLGGNSRTVLLVTCSPAGCNASETLCTLRFGVRAKTIKNRPTINKEHTVQQLLIKLELAESKIKSLTQALRNKDNIEACSPSSQKTKFLQYKENQIDPTLHQKQECHNQATQTDNAKYCQPIITQQKIQILKLEQIVQSLRSQLNLVIKNIPVIKEQSLAMQLLKEQNEYFKILVHQKDNTIDHLLAGRHQQIIQENQRLRVLEIQMDTLQKQKQKFRKEKVAIISQCQELKSKLQQKSSKEKINTDTGLDQKAIDNLKEQARILKQKIYRLMDENKQLQAKIQITTRQNKSFSNSQPLPKGMVKVISKLPVFDIMSSSSNSDSQIV